MPLDNSNLVQIAKKFIIALQNRESWEDLLPFYHPEIEQTEFPNSLSRLLVNRKPGQLKDASEKGKAILLKEEYEIKAAYSQGNMVILVVLWTGMPGIPLGKIPAGGEMKANFAQFFEFEGEKIRKIRNYDCFEPFN